MSISQDAKGASKKNEKARKHPKNGRSTGIVTFHPRKAEVEELRSGAFDVDWGLDYLSGILQRNVGLSCGFDVDRGNFYCIARDKGEEWNDANAFSAFHSDFSKCLVAIAYGLRSRYPEFPDGDFQSTRFTDEW